MFTKATKEKSKLRLALMGPSGSGKTFTALLFATTMSAKVAVIDSERGSASKYADHFSFDTCDLESHSPDTYVKAIKEAEKAGYDVLVIDSLSHAWSGKDGALELVDKVAKRSQTGNSFAAWREVTPMHNALVDAILQSKCHVIATMRTKQEYVLEENERGKKVPRKVGMAPVQREGVEYEFDVIADMNIDHDFIVAKTRCNALDGLVTRKPTSEVAQILIKWLDGAPQPAVSGNAPTERLYGGKPGGIAAPDCCEDEPSPKPQAGSNQSSNGKASSSVNEEKGASAIDRANARADGAKPVGKEQMGQLLQAGQANGWDRKAVSDYVKESFAVSAEKPLTWADWQTAVKVIGRPENKGGKLVVDGSGKQLQTA